MKKRLLIISAHADDHIICAGTVFKLLDEGYEAYELLMTDSSEGNDRRAGKLLQDRGKVAELRESEFTEATKFLGIKRRYSLCQEDLNLEFSKELMLQVIKVIREVKPDIIFTMNETDYHKDHIATAKIVQEASFWASGGVHPELGDAHRTGIVLYGEGMLPIMPDVLVDISAYHEKKLELFRIYASQANDKAVSFADSLAEVRGYHLRKSKNKQYAEAFTISHKFFSILFDR